MQQTQTISVVITTYNRPDALAAVVAACFLQNDKNFEIIIADDGSAANTRACVAQLAARAPVPVHHVWQPHDGFRAAMARNRGTLAATGDYIIFLDGDCVPQRDFIARHRALAQPGFLVSGSRILLSQALTERVLRDNIDVACLGLAERLRLRLAGDMNKVLQTVLRWPDLGRARRTFSWRRIKSCNLGVWKSDLLKVNGFDERFTGWGHEDSDIVVRLFHAGVLRKDGAMATEVLHLWHPDAQRSQAAGNRRIVLERATNGATQASIGLREHAIRLAAPHGAAGA